MIYNLFHVLANVWCLTSGRKQSFSKLLDFSYIYMYYKPFDLGTKTFSKALKRYHIIFALTYMLTKFFLVLRNAREYFA